MTVRTAAQKITGHRALLALVSIVAALFMFWNLSGLSLRNWDEGIHAEVSREIVTTHNWVDLHFMNDTYFRKPPLKFWLSAVLMETDGPTEWAARAPNAAAGVAVVFLLCYWAWQTTKNRWSVPLLAGLFLSTTLYFMHTFRSGETDGILALFSLLAIYAYWRAKSRPRWIYWSAASIGLAIMTKSAAGVVPFIVMVIDTIVTGSWRALGWKRLGWSAAVVLAIVLPWHAVELVRFGKSFWDEYFFVHIVQRGAEAIVNPTAGPFWYFKIVWLRFFPTLLFAIPALLVIVRSLIRDRVRDERFLWAVWFAVGFIVATTAKSKLDWYLLPYYFPLLLLTVRVMMDWLTSTAADWLRDFSVAVAALAAFTFLPDKIPAVSKFRFVLPQYYLNLIGIKDANPLSVAVGVILVGAFVLWLLRRLFPWWRSSERGTRLVLAVLAVYLIVGGLWTNGVRIVKETSPTGYKEAMDYLESQPGAPKTLLLFNTTVWGNPAGYFYWNRHNAAIIHDAGPTPANLDRLSLGPNTYILTTTKTEVPVLSPRPLRLINTWNEIVLLDRP